MVEPEAPPWQLHVVDLDGAGDRTGLIEAVAAALAFPGWVGRNWDALQDALGDLSWLGPARGRVLVVEGWAGFCDRAPADALVVGSILDQATAEWAGRGVPLHVLGREPSLS